MISQLPILVRTRIGRETSIEKIHKQEVKTNTFVIVLDNPE
jgi:hypothetical protein